MVVIKRVTLLVNGRNIYEYAVARKRSFTRALKDIKTIAERRGIIYRSKARIYFDSHATEYPRLIGFAQNAGFCTVIGSSPRENFRLYRQIVKDAEDYLSTPDTDILALAAGNDKYYPITEAAKRCNKEFLLIYPVDATSHRLLAASSVKIPLLLD